MGPLRVLLEVRIDRDAPPGQAIALARRWVPLGFVVDESYAPVPMEDDNDDPTRAHLVIRGTLGNDSYRSRLLGQPEIVEVWEDAPITPSG